jgi:hypothetical protein
MSINLKTHATGEFEMRGQSKDKMSLLTELPVLTRRQLNNESSGY